MVSFFMLCFFIPKNSPSTVSVWDHGGFTGFAQQNRCRSDSERKTARLTQVCVANGVNTAIRALRDEPLQFKTRPVDGF